MTRAPAPSALLLDTHALLWWTADRALLSAAAAGAVDGATSICVSAVSAWELALLSEAGRVELDRPVHRWVVGALSQPRVTATPLDWETAVLAVGLGRTGFHRDPADRFLWATAVRLGLTLVTKDQQIHDYAARHDPSRVLW